jgi:hypothetical protein
MWGPVCESADGFGDTPTNQADTPVFAPTIRQLARNRATYMSEMAYAGVSVHASMLARPMLLKNNVQPRIPPEGFSGSSSFSVLSA